MQNQQSQSAVNPAYERSTSDKFFGHFIHPSSLSRTASTSNASSKTGNAAQLPVRPRQPVVASQFDDFIINSSKDNSNQLPRHPLLQYTNNNEDEEEFEDSYEEYYYPKTSTTG
jgi:hypothetical protein